MEGPGQLILILAAYFLLVRVIGPPLMQNRPAMQLKSVITTYNSVQVLACALVVQQVKILPRARIAPLHLLKVS
jgi:GNS1/SUR4 family